VRTQASPTGDASRTPLSVNHSRGSDALRRRSALGIIVEGLPCLTTTCSAGRGVVRFRIVETIRRRRAESILRRGEPKFERMAASCAHEGSPEQSDLGPPTKALVPRPQIGGFDPHQSEPLEFPLPHVVIIPPMTTVRSDESTRSTRVSDPLPGVGMLRLRRRKSKRRAFARLVERLRCMHPADGVQHARRCCRASGDVRRKP
jgi:hypothetical protein